MENKLAEEVRAGGTPFNNHCNCMKVPSRNQPSRGSVQQLWSRKCCVHFLGRSPESVALQERTDSELHISSQFPSSDDAV